MAFVPFKRKKEKRIQSRKKIKYIIIPKEKKTRNGKKRKEKIKRKKIGSFKEKPRLYIRDVQFVSPYIGDDASPRQFLVKPSPVIVFPKVNGD